MRRLRNKSIGAPDGFRYTHSETGHTSTASVYWDWIDRCHEHRKANNLPPMNSAQFEDQLCEQIGPEYCEYQEGDSRNWVDIRRLSLDDVIGFTKTLIAHVAQGAQYVSQDEANRRAKICSGCYFNVHVGGCGACKGLATLVVAGRQTDYDSNLKSCAVCKCTNSSQVHFPLAILEVNDTEAKQAQYPSQFCWKSKASPTYLPNP